DADARDAAEAASWFAGDGPVALLPGRGVGWGSGLTPPPHLVGERYRALDVLAAGGLVCASALALVEWLPPADARPVPLRLRVGEEPGIDGLSEHLALAGYERVDRVEERGQFAVRGGLVDVFPSTGREHLRVELFGDEIEQIRAFSPFTQRALHAADAAVVYPAGERRRDLEEPSLADDEGERSAVEAPADLVPPVDQAPDLVWSPDDVRRAWEEDGLPPLDLEAASQLDPFPRSQAHSFEAQRPAIAARGLSEAENELAGFVRAGNRVVVSFTHLGEARRQAGLLRKVDAPLLEPGEALPAEPGVRFAVVPARRGFVSRDLGIALLPDTQVFRKRPARARACELRRAPARRLRRPRGPRHREAARLRHERGGRRHARLPPPRVPRRRPAVRATRAGRKALALHRRRRVGAGALEARRQGLADPQGARPRVDPRARRRAVAALCPTATRGGDGPHARERLARAARGVLPVPGDRRPAARDRGGQGGPRGAAPDG